MTERKAGHYSEVLNFYIHTTFDLVEDWEVMRFSAEAEKVEGVVKLEVKRYSVTVEVGFLFDVDVVRERFLKVFTHHFQPTSLDRISLQDLVDRAVEQQMKAKEELANNDLSRLLAQMVANGGASEA